MKTLFSAGVVLFVLFLFSLIPAVAGQGPDEVEPNDTKALADTINGLTIEANIDEDDTDDWFKLEGQEGTDPIFSIDFDEDELEVDFEVYSDDELVETVAGWGPEETDSMHIPGVCYIHVYYWSGEGDYTIEIIPEAGECQGDSEVEPNDEKDLADLIEEDLVIEGYACEGEDDWFVVNGQEGYNPEIKLIYDDNECDIDLEVYSDKDLIGSLTETDSPDKDDFEIPGTCYIRVYAFEGEGEYTIEITPAED
jgi:hypothetical protein